MELWKLLIYIAIAVFVLLLIFFPEFRALFKGFTRLFVKDLATTPEGAEALYAQKIDEAQESYNKADNALRMASGKLSNTKRDLETLKTKLKDVETKCEALVKAGKIDAAQLKAEEREEIISDISRTEELLKAYQTATNEAQSVATHCEQALRKLKRESKEIVENMKTKKQLEEVYDDMDELKKVSGTDRLLDAVKEKNKDLNASVEGARVVHESKLSTRIQKADSEAAKLQSNDYLESLKKKYK